MQSGVSENGSLPQRVCLLAFGFHLPLPSQMFPSLGIDKIEMITIELFQGIPNQDQSLLVHGGSHYLSIIQADQTNNELVLMEMDDKPKQKSTFFQRVTSFLKDMGSLIRNETVSQRQLNIYFVDGLLLPESADLSAYITNILDQPRHVQNETFDICIFSYSSRGRLIEDIIQTLNWLYLTKYLPDQAPIYLQIHSSNSKATFYPYLSIFVTQIPSSQIPPHQQSNAVHAPSILFQLFDQMNECNDSNLFSSILMGMYSFLYKTFNRYILGKTRIGTHSGKFHCDQVLACAMLLNYTDSFRGAEVIRTRDLHKLQRCNVVVDVGSKYEPPNLLDHHQVEFQQCYDSRNIRMSSAGLVFKHYPQIVPRLLQAVQAKQQLPTWILLNSHIQDYVRKELYKKLIMYVDANDNGIFTLNNKDIRMPSTLWSRIAMMNPMWWEQQEQTTTDLLFQEAVLVAKLELESLTRYLWLGAIQSQQMTRKAYLKRYEIHPSGRILLLEQFMPWKSTLSSIQDQQEKAKAKDALTGKLNEKQRTEDKESKKEEHRESKEEEPKESEEEENRESKEEEERVEDRSWRVKFCVFKDRDSTWRVQAANEGVCLKKEWWGHSQQKAISDISEMIFVHATGFIGGASSREAAIQMAVRSLEEDEVSSLKREGSPLKSEGS